MKPTIEQIGDVPFPPKIPTLKEVLDGNFVAVEFADGSVTEYEFDNGPMRDRSFESMAEYEADLGGMVTPDVELTKRLKRYFIHVQNVYIIPFQ